MGVARLDLQRPAPIPERLSAAHPGSPNNLLSDLARGAGNNPALFGGGTTLFNRVASQPLFLVDPNSHFDPTTQLVLNPAAWSNPALGQFGVSAPYYNDFRWQRQPLESMAFGRLFRMGNEGKYSLQVRAEFNNIFNRLFYSLPSDGASTNPLSPTAHNNAYGTTAGLLSSGFGYVNWFNGASAQPRSGRIIARFTF
jgi:hypothetical protein